MIKNTGLNLKKEKQDRSPKDWIFKVGVSSECLSKKVSSLRKYLPIGEVQRNKKGDMMDCASREPTNDIETKITGLVQEKIFHPSTIKWINDNGYIVNGKVELSDAFIAIKSGTTKDGNSLITPWQTVHKIGMIPKAMLPFEDWMGFNDYHNPARITQKMVDLGLEWAKRIIINYDRAYEKDFKKVLKNNLLGIVVHAWPRPINGIYPRVNGILNHVGMGISGTYLPFYDNYIDSVDGDFIKQLATNYKVLRYAYRSIIRENVIDLNPKKDMISLKRAKDTKKVFVCIGVKKYWVNSWSVLEDFLEEFGFETLKEAQKSVEKVAQNHLDNFIYAGNIGNPSIWDFVFGGKTRD
jgi:hypothetical protein|tara:strand:- start:4178 stop:5236 length:1059 start_codon:yes stop_codon:yes gene_type:complete